MAEISIQNDDKKVVFQLFCGRWESANSIDHPGDVLKRLVDYDWLFLKKELGVDYVYLLGLWDTSGPIIVNEERGVDLRHHDRRCPSPFAITNHTRLNPLLGDIDDLEELVSILHMYQLKVICDFVPNHVGVAHPWVHRHPQYFKLDQHNQPVPAFSGDVLELNYKNPDLFVEMRSILEFFSQTLHLDGVRCDMAHLVPMTFWTDAIAMVKRQSPSFVFLGEAYSHDVFDLQPQIQLMRAGFDGVYDEPLFRNIRDFFPHSLSNILGHIDYVLKNNKDKWIHYLNNHDDVLPVNPSNYWPLQQLLLLLPGWQLFYNGTMWGYSNRLAHHWVDVLPDSFVRSTYFDENKLSWLTWFWSEKPILTHCSLLSSDGIGVEWKSATTSGTMELHF